jgi:hypothetical protein
LRCNLRLLSVPIARQVVELGAFEEREKQMSRLKIVGAVLFFAISFALAGQTAALAQEAVQEPGMESFYYPNADVTNGGAHTGNAYAYWGGGRPYDANVYAGDQVVVDETYPARRPRASVRHRASMQH